MKLIDTAILAVLLIGCDDTTTAPEPECVACVWVELADGGRENVTTVWRENSHWFGVNECTDEAWTWGPLEVVGISKEAGCEESPQER